MNQQEKDLLWTQEWHLKQLEENENVIEARRIGHTLLGVPFEGAGVTVDPSEPDSQNGGSTLSIVDGSLVNAVQEPVPGGSTMNTRRCLVIHFTAGASAMSSIEYWRNTGSASAHIVIARDGTIYQCRVFSKTAGHAGKSRWRDPNTNTLYEGLNSCSIGIEIANGGNSYPEKFSALPATVGAHKNGGPEVKWETYTQEQIQACKELAVLLVNTYKLDDVVGHEDVAPERKTDPGPAFPMRELRQACGFSGDPVVHWP